MSVLSDYTPDEQRVLLQSLRAAGVAISAASLGRGRETASEGIAVATFVLESEGAYLDNTLIGSILYDLKRRADSGQEFLDYTAVAEAPNAAADAKALLRQTVELLNAKAGAQEGLEFRGWLMQIAERAAEAGAEGGNFLGWGAVQVNDAERAALAELRTILGVP